MNIFGWQMAEFPPGEWGTYGQWASAIITGLAFGATFYVILRDAKVRKIAQARKVLYVSVEKLVANDDEVTGHTNMRMSPRYVLRNLSDEPLYRAFFYAHDGLKAGKALDSRAVILPGEEFMYDFDIDEPPLACFRDNSDVGWIRNIKGKVHPHRRGWGRSFERNSKAYAK